MYFLYLLRKLIFWLWFWAVYSEQLITKSVHGEIGKHKRSFDNRLSIRSKLNFTFSSFIMKMFLVPRHIKYLTAFQNNRYSNISENWIQSYFSPLLSLHPRTVMWSIPARKIIIDAWGGVDIPCLQYLGFTRNTLFIKNNRVNLSGVYVAVYYDEIIWRLRIFKTFGDPMHFRSESVTELSYSFLLIYRL